MQRLPSLANIFLSYPLYVDITIVYRAHNDLCSYKLSPPNFVCGAQETERGAKCLDEPTCTPDVFWWLAQKVTGWRMIRLWSTLYSFQWKYEIARNVRIATWVVFGFGNVQCPNEARDRSRPTWSEKLLLWLDTTLDGHDWLADEQTCICRHSWKLKTLTHDVHLSELFQ